MILSVLMSSCNFVGNGWKSGNNDLKDFYNIVRTGDIIFQSEQNDQNQELNFNFHGIIEKKGNSVFVWDNQNTIKTPLFKWVNRVKNSKVKVYRIVGPNFISKEIRAERVDYNLLMNSKDLEFVIEN